MITTTRPDGDPTRAVDDSASHARHDGLGEVLIDPRIAGIVSLVGVALSIVGSVILQLPGADLFVAMETDSTAELAAQLDSISGDTTTMVVGLTIWLVAFPTLALGGVLLTRLSPTGVAATVARTAFTTAIGAIVVMLVLMMTFVVVIAPAHADGQDVLTLARTVGFAGSTIDWIVTALVLGIGPVFAVRSGRATWADGWLQRFAALTLVVTLVELVGLGLDNRDVVFILVPVGLAQMAVAGGRALTAGGRVV